MHRSRSLGQSLVISSVFQWQRLSTGPLLQAVGDEEVCVTLGGKSLGLNQRLHLLDKTISLSGMQLQACRYQVANPRSKVFFVFLFVEREKSGSDWMLRWCKSGCTDTKFGDLSVALFYCPFFPSPFLFFLLSLVCYVQFRSVVSLQSPFRHKTDLEMATLRISQWLLWKVEESSLKIKLTCIMSSDSFAKSHQGQHFFFYSWRWV